MSWYRAPIAGLSFAGITFWVLIALSYSELSFRTWIGFILAWVIGLAVCNALGFSPYVFMFYCVLLDAILILAAFGQDIWLRYR